jgi:type-F conjugative transfer system pilin assembly protein TrbC
MKRLLIILLIHLSPPLFSQGQEDLQREGEEFAKQMLNQTAVCPEVSEVAEINKQLLKSILSEGRAPVEENVLEVLAKKTCIYQADREQEGSVMAFMSFSVPDSIWVNISHELEKLDGMIILQGLPKNNFVELAYRLKKLGEKGVIVPIKINPVLFEKYAVSGCPTIVVVDENESCFDKVSGNVSLPYSINLMAEKGETTEAKKLASKMRIND